MIKNCRSKWEAMYKWRVTDGKEYDPFPTWKKSEPTKNTEWKPLYSNPNCGQCIFGGWYTAGLKEFKRLQALVIAARANTERCQLVEQACIDRLRIKYKLDEAGNNSNANQATAPVLELSLIHI